MQQAIVLALNSPGSLMQQALLQLGAPVVAFENREALYENRRILFALPLDACGLHPQLYGLLAWLRSGTVLKGCVCGFLITAESELFTKSTACQLSFSANLAGAILPGSPLVEATGSLANLRMQAKNADCTLEQAFYNGAAQLWDRLIGFTLTKKNNPNLLVLHASSYATSNTMALWKRIESGLSGFSVTEIGLRNGAVEDCSGCPFTMCLHFGERGGCFYGGVMVREVYPALEACDGLVLLCPNYNDALSANICAFINRLTAIYRKGGGLDKALFGLVVSGYSGGDMVAGQLISGLCLNKGFILPPQAIFTETANLPGELDALPTIQSRADCVATGIQSWLQA